MSGNNEYIKRLGLNNLTRDQLDKIHQATLDILEEGGVKVCCGDALLLLKEAGATVDGDLARIPRSLVEKALRLAPARVVIYDRQGEPAMILEKDRVYFGPGSDTPYVIDLDSGQRRKSLYDDTVRAVRVADALEHIDFIMSMARANDRPAERADRYHFEAMVTNSTKPIIFDATGKAGLSDIIEMATVVTGSRKELAERPFIIHYTEPTSPLIHSRPALEKMLVAAEAKIPLVYAPAVMCGATGPVTTAGSLVVANAEMLSGLVIQQLKAEGAPFIYGGGTPPLNMITAICTYGDPQGNLGWASLIQLARYYNLPSFSTAGCSDAQVFDQQAAMEAGLNLFITALAGGSLIHDLGYIGSGLITSLEFLVMCNETAGAIKFMTRGVEVSPRTLAVDVIRKTGPGGHFLTDQHTFENFRSEMHYTRLLNRNNYSNWVAAGSKSAGDSAKDLVNELLHWHEIPRLDLSLEERIHRIAAG